MQEFFNKKNIYLDVKGYNFFEVLTNIFPDLKEKQYVEETFFESVLERERNFPTGLEFPEYNIAIPHTDPEHVKTNSIILIKSKNPIEFNDMGTNSKVLKTNIILLLLINKAEDQVKVLSGIIKKFADSSIYYKILEENNEEKIYNLITT